MEGGSNQVTNNQAVRHIQADRPDAYCCWGVRDEGAGWRVGGWLVGWLVGRWLAVVGGWWLVGDG